MTAQTQPPLDAELDGGRRRNRLAGRAKAAGAVFGVMTLGLTIAAYQYGDGYVWIGDRTISDMNVLEVTGASAAGAAGIIAGLGAALVAIVAALAAAVASLAVAVLVGGLGVFFAIGIVTGPVLLALICGIAVKRRYYPDVI